MYSQLKQSQPHTDELIVCGGGAFNTELLARLQQNLPDVKVQTTEDYGIPPEWLRGNGFCLACPLLFRAYPR